MKTGRIVKRRLRLSVVPAFAFLLVSAGPAGAWQQKDEMQQVAILESTTATLQQKDAACAELKRVGTAKSVPVLAALLNDKDLAHSARYALETIPGPEAGTALVQALEKTSGAEKAGVIQSIGDRLEATAEAKLIPILSDPDTTVAVAAADVLGRFGTENAAKALLNQLHRNTNPQLQSAFHDALLSCGNALTAKDRKDAAGSMPRPEPGKAMPSTAEMIFQMLSQDGMPAPVRAAAHRGLILAAPPQSLVSSQSPDPSLARLLEAIRSDDGPRRQAGLLLARDIESPAAAQHLYQLLPKLTEPVVKIALIEALRRRTDIATVPWAVSTLIETAGSSEASVRTAAIVALGDLGDASAVEPLVQAAVSQDAAESKAARQALVDLRRGKVNEALVEQLSKCSPEQQKEIVRALVGRGAHDAAPALLKAAAHESSARAALDALSRLATPAETASMVEFVKSENSAGLQAEAASALLKACLRLQAEGKQTPTAPILSALRGSNAQASILLLPLASVLKDEAMRGELRKAISSTDPVRRQAAVKALCNARDTELLPDLLAFMKANDATQKIEAVRAYLRLVGDASLTPERKLQALEEILPIAQRAEEKWAILGSLAETTATRAIDLALPMLEDSGTRSEAAQAITKIAAGIHQAHPQVARAALQKVIAVTNDPASRQAATAVLDQISTTTK